MAISGRAGGELPVPRRARIALTHFHMENPPPTAEHLTASAGRDTQAVGERAEKAFKSLIGTSGLGYSLGRAYWKQSDETASRVIVGHLEKVTDPFFGMLQYTVACLRADCTISAQGRDVAAELTELRAAETTDEMVTRLQTEGPSDRDSRCTELMQEATRLCHIQDLERLQKRGRCMLRQAHDHAKLGLREAREGDLTALRRKTMDHGRQLAEMNAVNESMAQRLDSVEHASRPDLSWAGEVTIRDCVTALGLSYGEAARKKVGRALGRAKVRGQHPKWYGAQDADRALLEAGLAPQWDRLALARCKESPKAMTPEDKETAARFIESYVSKFDYDEFPSIGGGEDKSQVISFFLNRFGERIADRSDAGRGNLDKLARQATADALSDWRKELERRRGSAGVSDNSDRLTDIGSYEGDPASLDLD